MMYEGVYYLSIVKHPQNVILRTSTSVGDRPNPSSERLNPISSPIRKARPEYIHPLESRPQPASCSDIIASAWTEVREGVSPSAARMRFASLKKWSPLLAGLLGSALASSRSEKWHASARIAFTKRELQYLVRPLLMSAKKHDFENRT